jgi:hypothetical protein
VVGGSSASGGATGSAEGSGGASSHSGSASSGAGIRWYPQLPHLGMNGGQPRGQPGWPAIVRPEARWLDRGVDQTRSNGFLITTDLMNLLLIDR